MNKNSIDYTLLTSVDYLAERGFHGETIAQITGLSRGQVYYRTKALGKKLKDYRDGKSLFAKQVIPMTLCVRQNVKAEDGCTYQVKTFVKMIGGQNG